MDLEVHNALLYATARSRQVRAYSLLISNLILWKKYSLLLLTKFALENDFVVMFNFVQIKKSELTEISINSNANFANNNSEYFFHRIKLEMSNE